MSVSSSNDCWRTASLQKQRSVSSIAPPWPTLTDRRELQRFLRFANFYCWFIRGFSSTVQPLTALTSTKVPFRWTPEADTAFMTLKTRFSTAPILVMPNPEEQFVLEVDASDTSAGAVLSQWDPDVKVQPCAYLSRRLSPAERNYAVGDRELLALKTETPETILPSRTLIGTTRLEIEDQVERSLGGEAMPVDTPANRMYILEGARSEVLKWAHLVSPPWPVIRESAAP